MGEDALGANDRAVMHHGSAVRVATHRRELRVEAVGLLARPVDLERRDDFMHGFGGALALGRRSAHAERELERLETCRHAVVAETERLATDSKVWPTG